MPWNGTMPDGGPSYCFDLDIFAKSDWIHCPISVSREKHSIIYEFGIGKKVGNLWFNLGFLTIEIIWNFHWPDTKYLRKRNTDRHLWLSIEYLWILIYQRWDPFAEQRSSISPNEVNSVKIGQTIYKFENRMSEKYICELINYINKIITAEYIWPEFTA